MPNRSPYRGALTPAQAAEGIQASVQNAKRLIEDADLLFQKERWPSAFALAVLSIEELGKVEVLRELLLVRDNEALLKKVWKEYTSHVRKNEIWILPFLNAEGASWFVDAIPLFAGEQAPHAVALDFQKQAALYTDVFDNCNWVVPSNAISRRQAARILFYAKSLTANAPHPLHSKAGLELLVKHFQPLYNEFPEQSQALTTECLQQAKLTNLNFFEEAHKAGLLSNEEFNNMKSRL